MAYLVDTHILIWWLTEPDRLPTEIDRLLEKVPEQISYSVVSPWEIAIKHAKGKLPKGEGMLTTIAKLEFACLPISLPHIEALRGLPTHHGDPFDRMLAAQCMHENLTLITADKRLAAYPIKVKAVGF
jgi:PIN domain nuclease of toxin-antitoxin system